VENASASLCIQRTLLHRQDLQKGLHKGALLALTLTRSPTKKPTTGFKCQNAWVLQACRRRNRKDPKAHHKGLHRGTGKHGRHGKPSQQPPPGGKLNILLALTLEPFVVPHPRVPLAVTPRSFVSPPPRVSTHCKPDEEEPTKDGNRYRELPVPFSWL
jgi:hypothetical protein